MELKIMTYNIQHGLDYKKLLKKERVIDLDKIINVLKKYDPDIVAFNEVYNDIEGVVTTKQVDYIAKQLGYNYYAFGKSIVLNNGIEYGNGLISKYPLDDVFVHKIPDPIVKDEKVYYETRTVLEANVIIENEFIKCLVTHLGLANSEKDLGTNKIMQLLNSEKIILMGDFNMHDDNKNIIQLKSHLIDTGDYIEGFKYTYPSVNANEKIDYIFCKGFEVKKAYVVEEVASDHFPCFALLNIY